MLRQTDNYQQRKASLEELDELIAKCPNPRWIQAGLEFRAKIQEGDELWEFCTAKHTWDNFAGRAGYLITRDGETVATLLTALN